jgi:hypothetical protein
LIIALLVMTVPLRAERLVGTDVAHAFLLVGVAAVGHLFLGDVDLALAGKLLVGSLLGVLIGSLLTLWVPRRPLQIGLDRFAAVDLGHSATLGDRVPPRGGEDVRTNGRGGEAILGETTEGTATASTLIRPTAADWST